MKNTLKWTNLTQAPFTTKIYRGTSPLDKASPGTAIVTLTGGESQYEDSAVTRGVQYYYLIETIKGSESAFSNNIPLQALPRRGPGPVQLKQGDYNYGYFGTIPSREFISTQGLIDAVGSKAVSLTTRAQEGPVWHKWARNGKVLFVPNGPLYRSVTWKQIYDDGLVYGVDGNGPSNAGAGVNQLNLVNIAGSTFKVRLMTGFDDNLANLPPTEVVTEAMYPNPNEWNDLIYPLCEYTPTLQRMANVQQGTRAQLLLNLGNGSYWAFLQERVSLTGNCYVAGANSDSRACIAARTNLAITGTGVSVLGIWWPVLELIEA